MATATLAASTFEELEALHKERDSVVVKLARNTTSSRHCVDFKSTFHIHLHHNLIAVVHADYIDITLDRWDTATTRGRLHQLLPDDVYLGRIAKQTCVTYGDERFPLNEGDWARVTQHSCEGISRTYATSA